MDLCDFEVNLVYIERLRTRNGIVSKKKKEEEEEKIPQNSRTNTPEIGNTILKSRPAEIHLFEQGWPSPEIKEQKQVVKFTPLPKAC